jgi:hypothetical protein
MTCFERKVIRVSGSSKAENYGRLFTALELLFPVIFQTDAGNSVRTIDGLIILESDGDSKIEASLPSAPAYIVVQSDNEAGRRRVSEVHFTASPTLNNVLRNQQMGQQDASDFSPLFARPGDEILATSGEGILWLTRSLGGVKCQFVGMAPPALREGELLFEHFSARAFIPLLPLMHFLRELSKEIDWQAPVPRSCFVFDDPSLYYHSYGFLDFRLLARHALEHNYFASIGMVPLDAWWVNKEVAAIFRASPRLSLLIHGNNHLARELLFLDKRAEPLQILAQALRRMQRLETIYDLPFIRIMEAPHAAITSDIMEPLLSLGYDAVLGTPERLSRDNPKMGWPTTLGMDLAEMGNCGFPILPRIKMSAQWKTEVLLAAFLGQAIIIVGHHPDAKGGLDLLAEFAAVVNQLEGRMWASPQEIARSNYKWRLQAGSLRVKLYSRAVRASIPEGTERVFIHRPWIRDREESQRVMVMASGRVLLDSCGSETIGPLAINGEKCIDIVCPPVTKIEASSVLAPKQQYWALLRKVLMEARDRSAPLRLMCKHLLSRNNS